MTDISSAITAAKQSVQDVVRLAEQKLDSSGITEWTTSQEVIDVSNAITGLGSRAEKDAAWEQIDRPAFIDEMYGAGLGGAVSEDNRATIFANIAQQADGETLADFGADLLVSGTPRQGEERYAEFSEAIATHASAETKAEYIEAIAGQTTIDADGNTHSGIPLGFDPQASSAATVLASMSGDYLNDAVAGLSDAQFEQVVAGSVESTGYNQFSESYSYDASGFTDLSNTIATHGSTEVKARFVDTAGHAIDAFEGRNQIVGQVLGQNHLTDGGLSAMTDGVTNVIRTDAEGIFEAIIDSEPLRGSGGVQQYVEELVRQGDTETLAEVMTDLATGTNPPGDHTERFNTVDENGRYTTAENLGYFTETIVNAVEAVDIDAQAEAELVGSMLSVVKDIIPHANGSAAINEIFNQAVTTAIGRGNDLNVSDLVDLAKPDEGGISTHEGNSLEQFNSMRSEADDTQRRLARGE